MKTNLGFVEFAKQVLAAGAGYVYGTFGDACTISLLNQCAARYPANNLAGGQMRKVGEKWLGKPVTDCIGLLKWYMFTGKFGDNPHSGYNLNYDTSANGAFNNATVKGPISTLPEIPGICLHMNGHFGVYIGGGWAIEARGTYYGVVKTRVKDRPWTYWFKSPWLEYTSEPDFKCDTTTDISLALGEHYQIKVTAPKAPKVNVGTDGVVALLPRYQSGGDYFYYLVGFGASETATGIFVNGVKQFVAHMK
jgi:hypothetical protein